MGFSRWEYWRGLPGMPPGEFPHIGIEPASLVSVVAPGKPNLVHTNISQIIISFPHTISSCNRISLSRQDDQMESPHSPYPHSLPTSEWSQRHLHWCFRWIFGFIFTCYYQKIQTHKSRKDSILNIHEIFTKLWKTLILGYLLHLFAVWIENAKQMTKLYFPQNFYILFEKGNFLS